MNLMPGPLAKPQRFTEGFTFRGTPRPKNTFFQAFRVLPAEAAHRQKVPHQTAGLKMTAGCRRSGISQETLDQNPLSAIACVGRSKCWGLGFMLDGSFALASARSRRRSWVGTLSEGDFAAGKHCRYA